MSENREDSKKASSAAFWTALLGLVVSIGGGVYAYLRPTTEIKEAMISVINEQTNVGVSHAQVSFRAQDGMEANTLTDESGSALLRLQVRKSRAEVARLDVLADGFKKETVRINLGEGDHRAIRVVLEPIERTSGASVNTTELDVMSGVGANWGSVYELCSAPILADYKILTSKFELVGGDRKCGDSAECAESSHSDAQVCYKTRLQGLQNGNAPDLRTHAKAMLSVTIGKADAPIERTVSICHLYGEANQGSAAFSRSEECAIPQSERLDQSFHQTDFSCCGGGATSNLGNAAIPPGIEIRATGSFYWAITSASLSADRLKVGLYCGPAAAPGPGCNIDARVIAHYR